MKISSARRLNGNVTLPGDKSISHRAALIAACAEGPSRLSNFSSSLDCVSTLNCLRSLGVSVSVDDTNVRIDGKSVRGLSQPERSLDCGNSGSTMRMLAGLLAGQPFSSELTGDESLKSRPMKRIIEPLERMGAQVQSQSGRPPLRITPANPLKPIRYELPVASAQVKSCVLLAGLQAGGETTVIEHVTTRDHTERMLEWYGVPVRIGDTAKSGWEISVKGPARFTGRDVQIPGDVSSAAFLVAAATLLPDSNLTIQGIGLNPTRTQLISELELLGAKITMYDVQEFNNEPVGTINVDGGMQDAQARGTRKVSGETVAQLIDELPLLAVLGTQVNGGIEVCDAKELRVKESDRIATTVENLRAMGADVEEYPDGFRVDGPTRLKGARLNSHGDHRIAMAFSVAALVAHGDSEIVDADCVDVSFPGFFSLLESLVER
ncbi:MAG: 3-phosphoshikimate 1-carboxyvinyltransferase [Acidobacteria bacterium]|nr:MAG: 3-phosphoshikimate 1-carboxyvinyltransferase [Acidobacteriota bacterium]